METTMNRKQHSGIVKLLLFLVGGVYMASLDVLAATPPMQMTVCPSVEFIHKNVRDGDWSIGAQFRKWTKDSPEAGERLTGWVKAETKVNDFLGVSRTFCYYESTKTDEQGNPRIVIIVTNGEKIGAGGSSLGNPPWSITVTPEDRSRENWELTCVESRTKCEFPVD